MSLHPSGAEAALGLAGAAIFSWIAAFVVFAIAMIGSVVAGVQLRRRSGSTFNLVFASLFLAVSSLWAVFMTVAYLSELKRPNLEGATFVAGPGMLMAAFSFSWFLLALVARLRRSVAPRGER